MYNNPIKWSGSKKCHSEQILTYFPEEINTYFEPFCGSCSVMFELLSSHIKVKIIICSDINKDLINLWNCIKSDPEFLSYWYNEMWIEFNSKNIQYRKNYFNNIRKLFNEQYCLDKLIECNNNTLCLSAVHFLFLLRVCFSGLVRYNQKGLLNTTCHFSRPGIDPKKLDKILIETSKLLNDNDVTFEYKTYTDIKPECESDFMFLDPPYSGSNDKKMYYGAINEQELIDYCNNLPCNYALTYEGDRGENKAKRLKLNNTNVILLNGKNSSYSRMNGDKVIVNELLYTKKAS
jgi:DNA adenine methylase